jgi:hypothetical protein
MVEVLLGKEAFDMDAADEEGNTLLHLAARHGNRQMCEVLLAAGSAITRNKQGHTPIDVARQHQHHDCDLVLTSVAKQPAPDVARKVDASVQVLKQGCLALISERDSEPGHLSVPQWTAHYALVRGMTLELFRSKNGTSPDGGHAVQTVELSQARAFIPPIPSKIKNADRFAGEFCVLEKGSDATIHVRYCTPGSARHWGLRSRRRSH